MKFEEAELVMTNDGDFYRGFTAATTRAARHFNVTRAFRRLFPDEIVTEKKIQMLLFHYEKEWSHNSEPKYPSRTMAIAASIMKRTNVDDELQSNFKSGEPMSTPKLIETIHYVNGVDVRKLSDDQLISIIAQREFEIGKLNSTKQVPARLKKRASELQTELDMLVAFLDSLDSTPTT